MPTLSTAEFAQRLGVTTQSIRKRCFDGVFGDRAERSGATWLISVPDSVGDAPAALASWLSRQDLEYELRQCELPIEDYLDDDNDGQDASAAKAHSRANLIEYELICFRNRLVEKELVEKERAIQIEGLKAAADHLPACLLEASKRTDDPWFGLTEELREFLAAVSGAIESRCLELPQTDYDPPTEIPPRGISARRIDQLMAERNRLHLREQQGFLVSREKLKRHSYGEARAVRDSFQALANTLAPQLPAMADDNALAYIQQCVGHCVSKAHSYINADGLQPDPDQTVSEWADEFRVLSSKSSSEAGRWRTQRTPYLREIMDHASCSSPTRRLAFMAGTQLGKSEALLNILGYGIHRNPCPILLVQPTIELAQRFVRQRISDLVETPVIKGLIAPTGTRAADSEGNTKLAKSFPGGVLQLTGANSPSGLRSMPIALLLGDELSAWPADAGGEGDPLALAEKRTQTFSRHKIILASTPTVKDFCPIEREFLRGDQRRYYVPCPYCGEAQWLKWQNIRWPDGDPTAATYVCEHCGSHIEERYKTQMIEAGEWRPTAPASDTVSYHLSSLYSPLGWTSWGAIAKEWLRVKHDAVLLKTWVNTLLGEPWDENYLDAGRASDLAARAEDYRLGTAPEGVILTTAGVDVQDDRLEVTITGWGPGEESWTIDHQVITGNPATAGPWQQLDLILATPIPYLSGGARAIDATAVDSGGHFTNEVYAYVRERQKQNVIAVKGSSQKSQPIISRGRKQDVKRNGVAIKNGVTLYSVGTDTAKDTIYGRLATATPGPAYLHFPEMPESYFKQFTAEKLELSYIKGHPVRSWVLKSGARNEALDCFVYSLAALHWLYQSHARDHIWEVFRRKAGKVAKPKQAIAQAPPDPPAVEEKPPENPVAAAYKSRRKSRHRAGGGSFVSSW